MLCRDESDPRGIEPFAFPVSVFSGEIVSLSDQIAWCNYFSFLKENWQSFTILQIFCLYYFCFCSASRYFAEFFQKRRVRARGHFYHAVP